MSTPRFMVIALAVVLPLVTLVTCSRASTIPEAVTPTAEHAVQETATAFSTAEAVQQTRPAGEELQAVFRRLLKPPTLYVTSRFFRTTYLPMKQEGVANPRPFVFGNGPVESRGYFLAPGSFQLRQRVYPPFVPTLPDGTRITVDSAEWFVSVTDGELVSAASTGLASVLPPGPRPEDLLAQFLAVSLTGWAFDGGLDEFLTFESVDFVPAAWNETGAATVIEARRDAISGGVEIWRFAVNHDGQLQRISFSTQPPLVSVVGGRLESAPNLPAVLTIVALSIEVLPPLPW